MLNNKRPLSFAAIILCCALAALFGCGGGDGSSGDTSSNPDSGQSTVALFLADGPTDEFDHIWIEVTQISLLPEGDGAPVILYETDTPTQLDLLALQDDDLLLAVNSQVPVGSYNKIRMTVAGVVGQQDDQMIDFHLASQKIDLNPKGTIEIAEGETLSLRLDIDAEKSIHIAGPNYNFRPVVFVDAGPMRDSRNCDHLIRGEITELLYEDEVSDTVIGFRMTPFNGLASLDVYFQDGVVIFDDDGQESGPEALAVDQMVGVKGRLETDGQFQADMVVIGEVQFLQGEVRSAVEDQQFLLGPGLHWDDPVYNPTGMPSRELKTVALSDGTLIMMADEVVAPEEIKPGRKAYVLGKYIDDKTVMNAIAVYLKARKLTGRLTAIEPVDGGSGYFLTIMAHMVVPYDPPIEGGEPDVSSAPNCFAADEVRVLLPASAPINVKGGTVTTIEALKAMLVCNTYPRVEVTVGDTPEKAGGPIHGAALTVWPEMIKVVIESVDMENRLITGRTGYKATTGDTVQVTVPEGTPIWGHTDDGQEPITLQEIEKEDHLMLVGLLEACEPKAYQAMTIVKMPGCIPPDKPCRPLHKTVKIEAAKVTVNSDGVSGAIIDKEGIIFEVTAETRLVDKTQHRIQQKMSLGDIQEGDTLVCAIVLWCDREPAQALMVTRVDPDCDDCDDGGDGDDGDDGGNGDDNGDDKDEDGTLPPIKDEQTRAFIHTGK